MQATVLIPTHDHCETLRHSVATAQEQTAREIEILIVGDGAPDETRRIVAELSAADSRIRYFDFPKGARHGELHRHEVLRRARGRIVAYLCDDDLWLPSHLERMAGLLAQADFANVAELIVPPSGETLVSAFDAGHPWDRSALGELSSGIPLSCMAHTLEAYRRLPHGWRTTPGGAYTDRYMARQFLEQSWCRLVSSPRATVVKFASDHWKSRDKAELLAAMAVWRERLAQPGFESELAWTLFEMQAHAAPHPVATPRHWPLRQAGFGSCAAGDTLDFSRVETRQAHLSWGWSVTSEGGDLWTEGAEARVTLQVNQPHGRLMLAFQCRAGFHGGRVRLPVEVVVNGESAAQWKLWPAMWSVREVEVTAAARLDIRFLMLNAAPLLQVSRVPDRRKLGFHLRQLGLRQLA